MDVEEESGEEIPLDPSEQQILDTANQLQAMGYSAEDVLAHYFSPPLFSEIDWIRANTSM